MERENYTTVTNFLLLGLSGSPVVQFLLFFIFLAVYGTTVLGNLLIVALVACEHNLHTPMYLLLGNLSFLDFCYSSVTAPKMLVGFLFPSQTISYGGCVAQIFFFHFIGGIKIFLLTIMAYDRYVAIFHPLRYMTIMSHGVCVGLVTASWVGGFIHSIVQVVIILQLPFCGPNKLDNFYCDVPQVVNLACTNTITAELLMVSNSGLVTLLCFVVLLISYSVLLAKLRTYSSEGRSKALSTCASHITVVTLIFGPCIYIYARPFRSFLLDKAVSLLYTVITPILNPFIYTLRNKDVQMAMKKFRKMNM
ncbi:olfactory receptor 4D5-like [Alligator mississippiensis]|uniref:Olfactory receptor 4D5 n=1 Tax=Alligator mississippiensis TaxID=8496 RepID=A0A151MJT0_ALLMI|nr:olfactory receptor 4D5-like [Alligator mississippiensis]KYO24776.1 olfactory receptor 4D5 [Alligator mississippiensis]